MEKLDGKTDFQGVLIAKTVLVRTGEAKTDLQWKLGG